MSRSLLWRHIVSLTVGVYSSNHGVLYDVEKSVGCRSVRLSVYPSVYNSNKNAYSSIIINGIITRISDEKLGILYKKIKRFFKKLFFKYFRSNFWKIVFFYYSKVIDCWTLAYQVVMIDVLCKKSDILKTFIKKKIINRIFEKYTFSISFIINSRIIIRGSYERVWHQSLSPDM